MFQKTLKHGCDSLPRRFYIPAIFEYSSLFLFVALSLSLAVTFHAKPLIRSLFPSFTNRSHIMALFFLWVTWVTYKSLFKSNFVSLFSVSKSLYITIIHFHRRVVSKTRTILLQGSRKTPQDHFSIEPLTDCPNERGPLSEYPDPNWYPFPLADP